MKKLYFLGMVLLTLNTISAQSYRYVNTIFPSSVKTSNVVYGTAPFLNAPYVDESSTTVQNLVMDIYKPQGDTETDRPCIVFAHSGGFITGNRNHNDMVAFCDSFARKGYVTATIDYRQGFYFASNTAMHSTRAAYRGLQDGRSAIRYLRANAASNGIDASKVYLAGSSAGAFIALHSIYMKDPSEKPSDAGAVSYNNLIFPFSYSGPDLGAYDIGANLSQYGSPDAILSLWGAVSNTSLIGPGDAEPVFLVHGSSDGTVPFNSGVPFGVPLFPTVEGSNLINNKLNSLGMTAKETYFVNGQDHEFYGTSNGNWTGGGGNSYWDIIVTKTTDFLWKQHKPTAIFNYNVSNLTVNFTDQSIDAVSWLWDFGDGNTSTLQNPSHTYAGSGTFDVTLYIENYGQSWDEINNKVTLSPLPVTWLVPLKAQFDNNITKLSWSVSDQLNNSEFVVEHSSNGKHFKTLTSIDAETSSSEAKHYTYDHLNPVRGSNYYRIKQLDFDNQYSYSNTAVAFRAQKIGFHMWPNPSSDKINIENGDNQPGMISIHNQLGQEVLRKFISNKNEQISIAHLNKGIYTVSFEKSKPIRLIIQ